ncbi:MAG TPA: RNA polymerase sigma factor [Kofleriaceae bacterium]|nr:RNA polymerase sigma factor [Kofleriaceae bacterium]
MSAAALDFAAVYRDNLDYVWQSLRRLGAPPSDLEDLAHEVFLVVHRKLVDYDTTRPIKPWLFGIAFRVASDHRKKLARRGDHGEDIADVRAASDASPEAQTMRRQAIDLARRALESVDDEARAVFILAELDGVAVTDVATSLEIPVNTAYTRLRRARLAVANVLTGATP